MYESQSLRGRIRACSVRLGQDQVWFNNNSYDVVASPGWDTAWATGKLGGINFNPDTGIRTDVITDDMINSAVQAILDKQTTSTPTTETAS